MSTPSDWWTALLDHRKWILRVIRARARLRKQDEDDYIQEVLIRAAEATKRPAMADLGKWLAGIAINVLREHTRTKLRRASIEDLPDIASPSPLPDRQAIAAQRLRKVEEALDRLAPNLQKAYRLVEIEQRHQKEVCRLMDCGRTTLYHYLKEARQQLHSSLCLAFLKGTVGDDGPRDSAVIVVLRSPLLQEPIVQECLRFSFEWLEPGIYHITASADGYQTSSTAINLHAGENLLKVELRHASPRASEEPTLL